VASNEKRLRGVLRAIASMRKLYAIAYHARIMWQRCELTLSELIVIETRIRERQTQKEAARIRAVTPERIRQIERQALKKILASMRG
jgi:DNA-directed RNA polymerase sigma subunit (sigma70/sigma32)